IGVPHPDFGEGVVGVLVTPKGVALDEAALLASLKDTIAGFKVPKRLIFTDDLPRNAMGKVQKTLLRQQYNHTFD
ncbi:hypothetical protein NL433_27260, partial [Klebsiella pneumoniae]|nr:hypothetical protein [Klebsiella pneumoniae]